MAVAIAGTVSRLNCEGYADSIFIWTEFKGQLRLKASDGKNTWLGTLSEKQLEDLAEESKTPVDEYVQETVKALSSNEKMGNPAFVYSAELSESGVLQLTWKKQLSSGVKFWLGSVDLEPGDFQSTNAFFLNYCVDRMQYLFQKVNKLEEDHDQLVAEKRDAIEMLQKCVSLKDETEKDLFGKFKLVLNEKKSKIRKLIDLKDHLTDQNEEMKRSLWKSKSNVQPCTESEPLCTSLPENNQHCPMEVPVVPPAPRSSKPGSNVKSLLCDDTTSSCRPPSPPPMKKLRSSNISEDLSLPHPPLLTSKTKRDNDDPDVCQNDDSDMSMDANELLGMI